MEVFTKTYITKGVGRSYKEESISTNQEVCMTGGVCLWKICRRLATTTNNNTIREFDEKIEPLLLISFGHGQSWGWHCYEVIYST